MLLAAILRYIGIPTGFCYQRVSMGDLPGKKHAIHALNAVYISDNQKWIRLDPHRVTDGSIPVFSIEEEPLAFNVSEELGEKNYSTIHSNHEKVIIQTLNENTDCIDMITNNLPERLS